MPIITHLIADTSTATWANAQLQCSWHKTHFKNRDVVTLNCPQISMQNLPSVVSEVQADI